LIQTPWGAPDSACYFGVRPRVGFGATYVCSGALAFLPCKHRIWSPLFFRYVWAMLVLSESYLLDLIALADIFAGILVQPRHATKA
jgi:hypothetical protein